MSALKSAGAAATHRRTRRALATVLCAGQPESRFVTTCPDTDEGSAVWRAARWKPQKLHKIWPHDLTARAGLEPRAHHILGGLSLRLFVGATARAPHQHADREERRQMVDSERWQRLVREAASPEQRDIPYGLIPN